MTRPARPEPARRPLAGLRVVDNSHIFAMPYLSAMLADLGAEVIKTEPVDRRDQTRAGNPFFVVLPENEPGERPWDRSGTFAVLNRGKRSATFDLTQEAGQDAYRALVARSDIVVENWTPRVMRRWRLDYAHLSEINPGLVMISNTGYGHSGPWADSPVQGTSLEPMTGISHFSGYPGGRPWKVGQSYPDFVATWHGLVAVLAALRHRRRTGQGQWIDLGMYQACVGMFGEALLDYQVNGELGGRIGNRDAYDGLVQGCYQARGEDRWLALTVRDDAELAALLRLLPDTLAWPSGAAPATLAEAYARHDEVDGVLSAWVAAHTLEELLSPLRAAGIPAGPVNDARDLMFDEHLVARGFYQAVEHPAETGIGRRPVITRPWRSRPELASIQAPAPALGEANEYVFRDLLGYDREEYADLVADRVTGRPEPVEPQRPALSLEDMLRSGRFRELDPDYRTRIAQTYP